MLILWNYILLQEGVKPGAFPYGNHFGMPMNHQPYVANQPAARPGLVYMFPVCNLFKKNELFYLQLECALDLFVHVDLPPFPLTNIIFLSPSITPQFNKGQVVNYHKA